jgi:hypothetical protein
LILQIISVLALTTELNPLGWEILFRQARTKAVVVRLDSVVGFSFFPWKISVRLFGLLFAALPFRGLIMCLFSGAQGADRFDLGGGSPDTSRTSNRSTQLVLPSSGPMKALVLDPTGEQGVAFGPGWSHQSEQKVHH